MLRYLAALAVALPAVAAPAQYARFTTVANCSGTIATANVSQSATGVNADRIYLTVQNPSTATESLFVNYTDPASTTANSIELLAGGSISFAGVGVPTTAINVTAATAGHRFVCKQGGNN